MRWTQLKKQLPGIDIWVGGPAFAGAATGWLPQEVVDLDELLGDAPAGAQRWRATTRPLRAAREA